MNSSCYAAPCIGTNLPKKNKFQAGLGSYSVFKRYLANQAGKLRSQQEFVLLSYGVFDWLSIDLKGGAGYIKQQPPGSAALYYRAFLGGGYGFRLKFYDRKNIRGVFGFQHISIHPKTVHINGVKHKAVSDDWQFSLLGSYNFKKVTPYLGTRWSRYDYIHWQNNSRKRQKSDLTRSVGLIYGCDLPLTEKIWANLEGSSFDSEALSVSLNYNF
ncbi:MAG: hypothetical protein Q8N85_05740 [Candidatus Omnitrophota bacterium]|nr:hypothetical protein [Candidatus Omnitrophota bacterium]